MLDNNFENLYIYKGKEKFLRDIEEHNPLFLCTCLYLFIFFALCFYIISKSTFLDISYINQYITLNIGEKNTFSNDLKNASLYIFAAQATLIGLIFPIVIAYVSLTNSGRSSSDKLMNIYKYHTGFNILSNSSFLILTAYSLIFILDSFFNVYFFKISQFFLLTWFLFNLALIYLFLSKTLDFTYGSKKIEEVTKYTYNNKEKIMDGFLIIIDEIKFYIENKSIASAEELIINLADFIKTNFIHHNLNAKELNIYLPEIRRLIDNTLDYNNIPTIRRMLFIYMFIGSRLIKSKEKTDLSTLLEFHYLTIYDLGNKINLSDKFKESIYSILLESWSSWKYYLKTNDNRAHYKYYSFLIISLFLQRKINIDNILDIYLRVEQNVEPDWFNQKPTQSLNEIDNISDQVLLNFCIDTKILLLKNVFYSKQNLDEKIRYTKNILDNVSPLLGTVEIRSNTTINTSDDIVYSLLRVILNPVYSEYLNNKFERSIPSSRVTNRSYWMEMTSFTSNFTEIYAYIYDQFISNKASSNYTLITYIQNLDIENKISSFNKINLYLSEFKTLIFNDSFFDSKKNDFIKERFEKLILSIRELYLTEIKKYFENSIINIFYFEEIFQKLFPEIGKSINKSKFNDLVCWCDTLNNCENLIISTSIDDVHQFVKNSDSTLTFESSQFDSLFLRKMLQKKQKQTNYSIDPILEMLKLNSMYSGSNFKFLIFNSSIWKKLNQSDLPYTIQYLDYDNFLINNFTFTFIRDVNIDIFGVMFNNNFIKSIEILKGNYAINKSTGYLKNHPQSIYGMSYILDINFNFKINLSEGYPIYIFKNI